MRDRTNSTLFALRLPIVLPMPLVIRWQQGVIFVMLGTVIVVPHLVLPAPAALASAVLGILMLIGGATDLMTYRLPNAVTYSTIAAGLALSFVLHPAAPVSEALFAVMRGTGSVIALLSLRWCYGLVRGQEGLGLGDVKLAGGIGVWLPLEEIPMCFAFASFLALLALLILYCFGRQITRGTKIPFGVFLCPALWLTFFAGMIGS